MSKKKLNQDIILEIYSDYILSNNCQPKSVYELMKYDKRTEQYFYNFFGSLEALQKAVFSILFEKTIKLLKQDENFTAFSFKDKLLSLYFTYIENLTINRSFVTLMLTQNKMEAIKYLSILRKDFVKWVSEENECASKNKHIAKVLNKTSNEFYWMQFVGIIAYWLKDESKGLEKTDLFIEKSVNATMDLAKIEPPQSVLDFGKFLFKEHFSL